MLIIVHRTDVKDTFAIVQLLLLFILCCVVSFNANEFYVVANDRFRNNRNWFEKEIPFRTGHVSA